MGVSSPRCDECNGWWGIGGGGTGAGAGHGMDGVRRANEAGRRTHAARRKRGWWVGERVAAALAGVRAGGGGVQGAKPSRSRSASVMASLTHACVPSVRTCFGLGINPAAMGPPACPPPSPWDRGRGVALTPACRSTSSALPAAPPGRSPRRLQGVGGTARAEGAGTRRLMRIALPYARERMQVAGCGTVTCCASREAVPAVRLAGRAVAAAWHACMLCQRCICMHGGPLMRPCVWAGGGDASLPIIMWCMQRAQHTKRMR